MFCAWVHNVCKNNRWNSNWRFGLCPIAAAHQNRQVRRRQRQKGALFSSLKSSKTPEFVNAVWYCGVPTCLLCSFCYICFLIWMLSHGRYWFLKEISYYNFFLLCVETFRVFVMQLLTYYNYNFNLKFFFFFPCGHNFNRVLRLKILLEMVLIYFLRSITCSWLFITVVFSMVCSLFFVYKELEWFGLCSIFLYFLLLELFFGWIIVCGLFFVFLISGICRVQTGDLKMLKLPFL